MPVSYSGTAITWPDSSTTTSGWTGFKNRIINGAMMIDQRNAGASVTPTDGAFITDRWQYNASQASKFTAQQVTDAPTGFSNSLQLTVASAVSIGSGDYFWVRQKIEGYNVADFMQGTASAATITFSFYVKSSLTGTFGGSLQNSAGNRSYPFSYTISSANTWEQKTVTAVLDTTGTWLNTNGTGLKLQFGLGIGSTYTGTVNTWAGSELYAPTGATSVVGTNGATFYITGVQLERGSTASSFEYRPYGTELALCQRYYTKLSSFVTNGQILSGFSTSNTSAWCQVYTPVPFRASPTIGFSGIIVSDQVNYSLTITAIAGSAQTINGGGVAFTNNSGATQYRPCAINTTSSSGYVDFSAEL